MGNIGSVVNEESAVGEQVRQAYKPSHKTRNSRHYDDLVNWRPEMLDIYQINWHTHRKSETSKTAHTDDPIAEKLFLLSIAGKYGRGNKSEQNGSMTERPKFHIPHSSEYRMTFWGLSSMIHAKKQALARLNNVVRTGGSISGVNSEMNSPYLGGHAVRNNADSDHAPIQRKQSPTDYLLDTYRLYVR
jgi:hypothetical protein